MNDQIRNSSPLIHIEHLTLQLPPIKQLDADSIPLNRPAQNAAIDRFTKIGDGLIHLSADAMGHKAVFDSKFDIYRAVGIWPESVDADDTEKCIAQLNSLAYLGITTWRQPTLEEEFGMADHTKYAPACDTNFFPDAQRAYYRTSMPDPEPGSSCVFAVGFGIGGVYLVYRSTECFCRPVASVPPRQ